MTYRYIVTMGNEHIFSTPIADQASQGASAFAKVYGRDVSATRFVDGRQDRTVVYHADGSKTRTWIK